MKITLEARAKREENHILWGNISFSHLSMTGCKECLHPIQV